MSAITAASAAFSAPPMEPRHDRNRPPHLGHRHARPQLLGVRVAPVPLRMRNPLLAPEVREILQAGKAEDLVAVVQELHPHDAAAIISALEPPEVELALSMLPTELERDVFSYLEPEVQERYVLGAGRDRVKEVLLTLLSDDRAEFLERLDERVRHQITPLATRNVVRSSRHTYAAAATRTASAQNMTRTRVIGNRTRNEAATPVMAPDAPSM